MLVDVRLDGEPLAWDEQVLGRELGAVVYRFTLRDGLPWHDGAHVTAEDCVASLKRWSARDGAGQIACLRFRHAFVVDLYGIGDAALDDVLALLLAIDLAARELPRLYRVARKLAGEEAEDAVQDCLLRAYRAFPRLERREAAPSWLTGDIPRSPKECTDKTRARWLGGAAL